MKKHLLIIFLFCAFSSFSQELIQNDQESSITFTIKNFGFDVDGNFSDFKIVSNFNTENLKESFINAKIRVKSIFTDSEARDEHLMKSDYFDVEKYPEIAFKSSEIEKNKDGNYIVKGVLIIKGTKKTIENFLKIKQEEKSISMLANFAINRKDFGVGGSSFVLSKNVNIKMVYVANKN